MNLKKFITQSKKVTKYAESINELKDVSALDMAILKKNVENLYELLLSSTLLHGAAFTPIDKISENGPNLDSQVESVAENNSADTSMGSKKQDADSNNNSSDTDVKVEVKKETGALSSNNQEEELQSLFDLQEGNEVSDKIGHSKIEDIMRSMGINERIYTQNELFGGNKEAFQSSIEKLNGLESFEEARDFLLNNVAVKYTWNAPDRQQIARNFIRHINRRYKK